MCIKRSLATQALSRPAGGWTMESEAVCLTSDGESMEEAHPCSGCGTELTAPALITPTDTGESWWCEVCVRRTLKAIQKSSEGPEA
jgi:hypothetical protein